MTTKLHLYVLWQIKLSQEKKFYILIQIIDMDSFVAELQISAMKSVA